MGKIVKSIKQSNMATKVLSVVLVIAMLASAFVYFGDKNIKNVEADGTGNDYMEFILDRIVEGKQSTLNIVEIVPYTGQGEFRYYVNNDEFEGKLETNQNFLQNSYNNGSNELNTFGYSIRKDTYITDINNPYVGKYGYVKYPYSIESGEKFLDKVMPYYREFLAGKVHVDTIEANDTTPEAIAAVENADLIVISMGSKTEATKAMYERLFDDRFADAFYDKNGNKVTATSYDTYEKVGDTYVSRDLSVELYNSLVRVSSYGRYLDGYIKATPIILDSTYTSLTEGNGVPETTEIVKYETTEPQETTTRPPKTTQPTESWPEPYGQPDLVITDITWTPSNPAAGNYMVFSAVIKNQGTGVADSGVTNGVRFDVDGNVVAWSDNNTTQIQPGQSITVTACGGPEGSEGEWRATAGAHYVMAWVDDVDRIPESDNGNNQTTVHFNVTSTTQPTQATQQPTQATQQPTQATQQPTQTTQQPYGDPDLVVTDITWTPSNPAAGDNVVFSAVIKNQGTGIAQGGVIKGVLFRINGNNTWSDTYTDKIMPGESITVTANGGSNGNVWRATQGSHTINAWVDDQHRIKESNARNNELNKTINVSAASVSAREGVKVMQPLVLGEPEGVETPDVPPVEEATEAATQASNYDGVGNMRAFCDSVKNYSTVRLYTVDKEILVDKVAEQIIEITGADVEKKFYVDNKIRVLEVEPCNSYDYRVYNTNYKSWNATETRKRINELADRMRIDDPDMIEITYMPSNELNSKIDDLVSTYDIIILGTNTDILRKSNDVLVYNDRNLDGYIYLAFGDLLKGSNTLLGYLPTEYDIYNYSGRDWNVVTNTSAYTSGRNGDQVAYNRNYAKNAQCVDAWNSFLNAKLPNNNANEIYTIKNMYGYYKKNGGRLNTGGNYNDFYSKYSLGNIRLPDNDITDITREKLLKFAESGKCLVLADDIYNLDLAKIYPTSDVSELAQQLTLRIKSDADYSNVIKQSTIGNAFLQMRSVVPNINIISAPVALEYDADGFVKTYCSRDNIYFKFEVEGRPNTQYKVDLYVDKNADGIFKKGSIKDDTNELYRTTWPVTGSSGVATVEIKTKLADSFIGLLNWKIVATQVERKNGAATYSETPYKNEVNGYSAVQMSSGEVQSVRVLQITPIKQYGLNLGVTLNMNTPGGFLRDNLESIKNNVGYNIMLDTLTTQQFEQKYVGKKYTLSEDYGTDKDFLSNYDMVVIGFADVYLGDDITNNNGAMDNLYDYIERGGSVLFTHDTMTYASTHNYIFGDGSDNGRMNADGNRAGMEWNIEATVTFTQKLRNLVGLDKYGVTLADDDPKKAQKEKPMYASTEINKYTYGTLPGNDGKYHKYNELSAYEKGLYNNDSNAGMYVQELQGFNPFISYRANFTWDAGFTNSRSNPLKMVQPYTSFSLEGSLDEGMWTTTKVSGLNKGQVTMYPYRIGDSLNVAKTHGQYYELDTEDEDIIVWYVLDTQDGGNESSRFYSTRGKDGANNYYIYSKGNITYTGAGHSTITGRTENKLFINTIIRAIAGGKNKPIPAITNGSKSSAGRYVAFVDSMEEAKDYQLGIKVTDADLLSADQLGEGVDISELGQIKLTQVYWVKDDGTEVLIKTFQGANALYNGVKQTLYLKNTSLSEDDLKTIGDKIKGTESQPKSYAEFKIYAEDVTGQSSFIHVELREKSLFNLD